MAAGWIPSRPQGAVMHKKKGRWTMNKLKKVVAIVVAFLVVVSNSVFVSVNADELDVGVLSAGQATQGDNVRSPWATIIMQGNKRNPSDCQALKDSLVAANRGYTIFETKGWEDGELEPNINRVTMQEFQQIKNYDVAYYSGHGAAEGKGAHIRPTLNAIPAQADYDYGISSPINVAQALQVEQSNWRTDSYIKPEDDLRVLILSASWQLDSSVVKYYARAMRASGIMAIAGYHEYAPWTLVDEDIAEDFVCFADQGNSVWYSWEHANIVYPWAILVYQENYNQYYRMPGFPGNTYQAPSADAAVYRYANFLESAGLTPFASTGVDRDSIASLPLTISTEPIAHREGKGIVARETAATTTSVADSKVLVEKYLASSCEVKNPEDMVCVESYVACDRVDEGTGIVEDSRVVVERTYIYYDMFSGVKVLDSFVRVSVDARGISSAEDSRKELPLSQATVGAQNRVGDKLCDLEEARSTLLARYPYLDIESESLAYVPVKENTHRLCYEFTANHGFFYVDVATGDIVEH